MAKATTKGKMAKKPSGGGKAPRKRPAKSPDVDPAGFVPIVICSDCLQVPVRGFLPCDNADCDHITCRECIIRYGLVRHGFCSCTHCNAWPR